jgi:DNA-binding NarL/FixJ family response regulator
VDRTSVLVVDDSPLFLEQTSAWLSRERDIEIVGSASSGAEAIALVERLQPRVVLMDIDMPDMNGIEATRRLKLLPNAPAVLILTLYGDPAYRAAAAAAGAEGFLCKSDFVAELLPCVRRFRCETGGSAGHERGQVSE